MKQKLLILSLLITCVLYKVQAQYLVIKAKDGTITTRQLSAIANITFPSNSLLLNLKAGSAETYSTSNINKLYFSSSPTNADNSLTSNELLIYPNPVSDFVYFKNCSNRTYSVSIYRLDGVLIIQKQISSDECSIDVSSFSQGLYIVRANNQAFKLVKQ